MKIYRMLRRVAGCLLILTFLTTTWVYAEESVDSLEQDASALEQELDGLNEEAKALARELSTTLAEMETLSQELRETKEALAKAKGKEQVQYETMKKRVRYMYENDPDGLLDVLFSARGMADFLNRMTFMAAISDYDNAALEELVATRESIAKKEQALLEKQAKLATLQEELAEKESLLYGQITMASDKLASYQNKIAIARANAEAANNQDTTPIVPEPESPTPKPEPEKKDPVDNVTASDVELLAALIECEAGSTHYEGMLAVGSVVVNRMRSAYYPDTLRGVIYQSGQFPPATNGLVDNVLKRGIKNSCKQAAEDALAGKNNVGNCLSFRASSSGHAGTIIGSNVFF